LKIESSTLRRIAGYLFAAAILFFLARALAQTWDELSVSGFRFNFDAPRVAVSLALLVLARVFAVEAWRRIFWMLGEKLAFTFAMRVWFLSNLARYVPGNVWQVAAMIALVNEKGVSKTNAFLSQVIYTAISLSICGLFGLLYLLIRPEILETLTGNYQLPITAYAAPVAAVAFTALILILASPRVLRLIIAMTARLTRRELSAPPTTFARGLIPPLYASALWLTNGVAFYLFVSAIADQPLAHLPAFIAINAGAYWIGYASFITPSGLGFREGALALMLAPFFPTPVAVALSLVTRVWSTAGELLGVVLVWSGPRRAPRAAAEKSR